MAIYNDAPTPIDIYVNLVPATCPKLWFSDSTGIVVGSVLDCTYSLPTGTAVQVNFHAPAGYGITLETKAHSSLSPGWSAGCSATVTGTSQVPPDGQSLTAGFNILVCDPTTGDTVVWHDPKWTIKRPGSTPGFVNHETTELVRDSGTLITLAVNQAGNGNSSEYLSATNSLFVGSTLVMRPGVAIATTYTPQLNFSDPDGIGFEWSTDGGKSWNPSSAVASNSAAPGTENVVDIELRNSATGAVFMSVPWWADNTSQVAPTCSC